MQLVPFSANQGTTGVTVSAGVSVTLSKIVSFQVQPGMNLRLDRETVVMIKDNGATETANKSKAQIILKNARTSKTDVRAEPNYSMLKFNQDANLQYRPFRNLQPGQFIRLTPFSLFEIHLNSDQTVAAANVEFNLDCKAEE